MGLYDAYLAARIRLSDASLPGTVAVVVTETDLLQPGAYDTLEDCFGWAIDYGVGRVLVSLSGLDAAAGRANGAGGPGGANRRGPSTTAGSESVFGAPIPRFAVTVLPS